MDIRSELNDVLLRVITATCGVEEKPVFFQNALSEMHAALDVTKSLILLEHGGVWEEVACCGPLGEEDAYLTPMQTILAGDGAFPPRLEVHGASTQLMAPIWLDGSQRALLQLRWRAGSAPKCVEDEASLRQFCEVLGSYLSGKYVQLQVADAKRNLESIFDHLPYAVLVVNSNAIIERANKVFAEFFNVSFGQIIGKEWLQIVRESTSPESIHLFDKAMLEDGREIKLDLLNYKNITMKSLPFVGKSGEVKALKIFHVVRDGAEAKPPAFNYDFLKLYNLLSQPLTILSIISELLITNSSVEAKSDNLEIIRKEVERMIEILRREIRSMRVGDNGAPQTAADIASLECGCRADA